MKPTWGLRNELRSGLPVQVFVNLGQEVLQLLRLQRQRVLLRHEREQLRLELGVQPGDHELNGVSDLADTLVLGRADSLYIALHLLINEPDKKKQQLKTAPENSDIKSQPVRDL